MKKYLFFAICFLVLFATGCSDSHEDIEDINEIVPDEPEIVTPDEPIHDDLQNEIPDDGADSFVESESDEFESLTFDVSKLTPTKYPDAVEDSEFLSVEPKVLLKDNMVDLLMIFSNKEFIGVDYRYTLEVFIDGVWYDFRNDLEKFIPAEYSEDWESIFEIPVLESPLDYVSTETWIISTGTVLSGLPEGQYRIVKDVDGWKYSEFKVGKEITEQISLDGLKLSDIEISSDCGYSIVLEPAVIIRSDRPDVQITIMSDEDSSIAYFGRDFRLEVFKDDGWYVVRHGGYSSFQEQLGVGRGYKREKIIDYEIMFEELVPGTYRIIKNLREASNYYHQWNIAAEFTVIE